MTCQDTLSCLDRLVDNELTEEQKSQALKHIKDCENCKKEFEELKQVKNLLNKIRITEPNEEYWSEVTNLIKAKTTDVEPIVPEKKSLPKRISVKRDALIRSLISTAAAITILFTALLLGSQKDQISIAQTKTGIPFLATADIRDILLLDNEKLFSVKEQRRLAQGMLLVGMPGVLGRFAVLPELMILDE